MPIILSDEQKNIINLSVSGKLPDEISEMLGISVPLVLQTLSDPAMKVLQDTLIKSVDFNLNLSRMKRASDILPTILDGIDIISKLPPEKWKIVHFKLFEMLIKEIPKTQERINQTLLNFNFGNKPIQQDEVIEFDNISSEIDFVLKKLPAEKQIMFWQEVDLLAKKYINEFKSTKQIEVQNLYDSSRVS